MKNFNKWNQYKTEIENRGIGRFYKPREIWWCALGLNIGFEQDGKGDTFQRPILIIKAFSKRVCLAVPLTTSLKKNPYHLEIGLIENKQASVIISQITLIDTKRLINRISTIDTLTFESIRKAIIDFL
jgi:mRNA interferase MazF